MAPEIAAALGGEALLWLTTRPDAIGALLGAAGLDPAEARRRADDPEFLGFVLDFLLSDERLLLDFAAEAGVAPETPMRARMALPGGRAPHWT
jgi:hypothetical protein